MIPTILIYLIPLVFVILNALKVNFILISMIENIGIIVGTFYILYYIIINKKDKWINSKFILFTYIFCFILCKVNLITGIPLGRLEYGAVLIPKFIGVPLILPLTFLGAIILSTAIAQRLEFYDKLNNFLKSVSVGIFLLIIDIFLEPIASKLGFWSWQTKILPVENYIVWFVFSVLFASFGFKYKLLDSKLPVHFVHFYSTIIIYLASVIIFNFCR